MVIRDFDLLRVVSAPFKTDASLVIDPNRVLPEAASLELLETISQGGKQVGKLYSVVQHTQLPKGGLLDIRRQFRGSLPTVNPLGFCIFEREYHKANYITRRVKRQTLSITLGL